MNDAIPEGKCDLVDKLVLEGRFIVILKNHVFYFTLRTSTSHSTTNVYQVLVCPTDQQ